MKGEENSVSDIDTAVSGCNQSKARQRRSLYAHQTDIQTIKYVHLTNTSVSKVNILKFTFLDMCSSKYRGTFTCT